MAEKIWFITGTSRGFGREWTIAALERGDKVAATARDTATLDDLVAKYADALLPIQLDVTDHDADFAAVKQAHDHFRRLDVVVNNAGYGQFGFIEELSEQAARDQIETNLFGALWITQAALPYLREQRSGHIIQVSSIGGISAFANVGIYQGRSGDSKASPRRWPTRSKRSASTSRSSSPAASPPTGPVRRPRWPTSSRPTPTPTRTHRRSANSATASRATRRHRPRPC
jgi:NAD(P)-dependent dehydrogenase (short-subunit alcohol dehydrogenase family)